MPCLTPTPARLLPRNLREKGLGTFRNSLAINSVQCSTERSTELTPKSHAEAPGRVAVLCNQKIEVTIFMILILQAI